MKVLLTIHEMFYIIYEMIPKVSKAKGDYRIEQTAHLIRMRGLFLCRRIFSKKLRYDLVWLYHDFSVLGICLLVCERKKQTCIYAISIDFSSIV